MKRQQGFSIFIRGIFLPMLAALVALVITWPLVKWVRAISLVLAFIVLVTILEIIYSKIRKRRIK